MRTSICIFFSAFLLLFSSRSEAQTQSRNDSDLVQFTGFVVSHDSSQTIPFVTIRINGTSRGTYSDMQGYFSFVAKRSDVLVFSCIGYETRTFRIPDNVRGSRFKSVVPMKLDSFIMEDVVIHGYPTAEQLDYMFSRTPLPNNDLTYAQNNLRRKPLSDQANALPNDAYANSRWTFDQYASRAYYNGQPQPIPVLDVVAWSKFLKALQNGDLKRK